MSTQYPGGFITKSPVAPTNAAASGIWTVDQALQYVKAGTWPSPPVFIEDLFSTYLYTGNSSTQTITNNINLSGSGGLVWCKDRVTVDNHFLSDTALGTGKDLVSNATYAATTQTGITAFNTTGFTLGNIANANTSGRNYVSWTFRKQPKFFDVVTFTTNGSGGGTFSHSLGSVPGCAFLKGTALSGDWFTYHRSLTSANYYVLLNSVIAQSNVGSTWITWTSTTFTIDNSTLGLNANSTYVIYIYAHNAGGFPANGGGSTNGITCDSFTTDGSGNATVTLGYEPQWLLLKRVSGTGNWLMYDTMRGMPVGTGAAQLLANATDAEANIGGSVSPTATGFSTTGQLSASSTYIYIAIRRGPMKTPTVGTSVFSPIAANVPTGTAQTINFVPDMQLLHYRDGADSANNTLVDRLRGVSTNATSGGLNLKTSNVSAEGASVPGATLFWNNTGFKVSGYLSNVNSLFYSFSRAPGFFDEVCYTGTGAAGATAITHNLGVVPQMIIVKCRTTAGYEWGVYQSSMAVTDVVYLNSTQAKDTGMITWGSTTPTSAQFYVGNTFTTNGSGERYVAYLFATLAGVSKVGSYTGTAALQTVNCGFTTGARFVLIKRTDSTGDWYVWDSARGISSGADPYYLVNTNAADVTGTNYVDTDTTGFKVTAAAPAGLNAVGGNYIFLAIA